MTATTTIPDILRTIRSARKKRGYTQAEMADKMNMRKLAYQRLESGATKLDLSRLIQIIGILEIEI